MKSIRDNCINKACVWRAETDSSDPPVMDCPHFAKKPMTNADRIRAMTDEELANLLTHYDDWTDDADLHEVEIYKRWLDWLKQEAEQ